MKLVIFAVLCLATLVHESVSAQAYPSKPIRFIVPFSTGGGNDILARLIGQSLSARLGQSVVVDNRDGASTIVGTEMAARSLPDGYTLYMGNNSSLAINPALSYAANPGMFKHLPYDAIKDFAPITLLAKAPFVLVVNPSVPAKSLKELIDLEKAKPGKLNFASGGVGISTHLAGELLKNMANIDMVHVTYRGGGQLILAVISGEVEMTFTSIVSALPQIKTGKLRALAVTGDKRSPALPDAPTVAETSGLKAYEAGVWYGVLAPAKTPREIISKLNAEIIQVLKEAKVRERMISDGADIIGSTPEEFSRVIRADIAKWTAVVKKVRMNLE